MFDRYHPVQEIAQQTQLNAGNATQRLPRLQKETQAERRQACCQNTRQRDLVGADAKAGKA